MLSKETQYRIYAGTRKNDFTGWCKVEVNKEGVRDFWSLYLGNGYYIDRFTREKKTLFGKKTKKQLNIHMDRTIEDPDGDYKDLDLNMLLDVEIIVSEESLKFNSKNNSFILLSREPVDWHAFDGDGDKFLAKKKEENWSSFYR